MQAAAVNEAPLSTIDHSSLVPDPIYPSVLSTQWLFIRQEVHTSQYYLAPFASTSCFVHTLQ